MSFSRFVLAITISLLAFVAGPALAFDPNAGHAVTVVRDLQDGRILVGGPFTTIGGVSRSRIARLHPDGSVDESFDLSANASPLVLNERPDGSLIMGGEFTSLGGQPRNRIARLNADGSLDNDFTPNVGDGWVTDIVVQPDGRILVGGEFTVVNGVQRNRIARLHADGSLDTGFVVDFDFVVEAILIQPDGKIIAAGQFTTLNGQSRNRIARLHEDGSIDTGFNPNANGNIRRGALALQPDGAILMGGGFTSVGGVARNRMARLNPDGGVDMDFGPDVVGPPSGSFTDVQGILLQDDGNILISGRFSAVGGQTRRGVARLNPDGSVDPSFVDPVVNVTSSSYAISLALQGDGKVLIGGTFTSVGGQPRNRIARLHADGSLDVFALTPTVDFGPWPVGSTSVAHSAVIRNTGSSGSFEVTAIGTPSGPFAGAGGTCGAPPFTLAAGASCTLDYTFSPVTLGPAVTAVEVEVSTEADPVIIDLIGEGLAEGIGELQIEPDPLDFGSILVGDQASLFVTLTNIGNGSLDLTGVLMPDPTPWYSVEALAASDCGDQGLTLAPGESCTLDIQCEPRSLDSVSRIIQIVSTGSNSPTDLSLNCSGHISSFPPGVNGSVNALVVQPDGKLLFGGNFSSVNDTPRNGLARLDVDGTLDMSFHPVDSAVNGIKDALALQPDGKILVSARSGSNRRVARLNPDGSIDPGYTVFTAIPSTVTDLAILDDGSGAWVSGGPLSGSGFVIRLDASGGLVATTNTNGRVHALSIQPNGQVVIVGGFTTVGGDQFRNYIARLNPDGSIDPDYNPNSNGVIRSVRRLSDGMIIVSGSFGFIGGVETADLARLNVNGGVDGTFQPGGTVCCGPIVIQPDGKIVVGSPSTNLVINPRIARRHQHGGADETFLVVSANNQVVDLALQPDGKVWAGGSFTSIGGQQSKPYLVRLNANGSLDVGPGIPALQATPDPLDFGAVAVGGQAVLPLTVTNDNLLPGGDGALDLQGLIAPNPPFFVENLGDSDCADQGLSLDPGESCTIDVRCEPSTEGTFTDVLAIESNDLWSPTEVVLTCEGVLEEPALSVTPDTVDFGEVEVDTSSTPRTVTLTSTGTAPVEITVIEVATAPFERTGGDCPDVPFDLDPSENCTLEYVFAPTAVGGVDQTLTVTSNADPASFTLVGEGTAPLAPVANITPASFDFTVDAGDGDDDVLNVGNIGDENLIWSIQEAAPAGAGRGGDIVIVDNVNYLVANTTAGSSINWLTGATCDCDTNPGFHFNPWSSGGDLSFWWWSGTDDRAGLSLDGTTYAVLEPGDQIGPASTFISQGFPAGTTNWRQPGGVDGYLGFRFNNGGTINYGYVRLTTTGETGHPATIVSYAYNQVGDAITIPEEGEPSACDSPTDINWLSVDPDNGATPGGGSVPVTVAVDSAGLAVGDYEALLCVTTNDPDAALVTIPVNLTVTGPEPPQIDVNPESLAVTLEAGDTTTETLTVHNLGEADLTWEIVEEAGLAGGVRRPLHPAPESAARITLGDAPPQGLITGTGELVQGPANWAGRGDDGFIAITHSAVLNMASNGTPYCGQEGTLFSFANQFLRVFHLSDFGIDVDFQVQAVLFAYGLNSPQGEETVTVNLYTLEGDFTYDNLTLLVGEAVTLAAEAVEWEEVLIEALVPAGSTLVMEIAAPSLVDAEARFVTGYNWFGETAPSYIASPDCEGLDEPATYASIGFPDIHLVMAVGGVLGDPVDCALPDWLDVNPTTGTLGEDEEEDINVGFSSAGLAPGEHTANLCIGSNDPANPLVVVPVTLNVDEAPPVPGELDVDPALLNFGPVMIGDDGILTFTVANTAAAGAEAIELSAIDLTDGMPGFGITGGTCEAGTTSLAPDESCTVEVTFAPDGEGAFSGEVTVTTADAQSAAVALSGTGTALPPAMLSVDPAALDFGELNIGHNATLSLTISNAAEAPAEVLELNLLEISTGGSAFEITGGDCAVGTELAPGESCMAEITFSPASEGDFNGLMIVGSADGQSMAVSLEGGAVDPGDAIFRDRFEEAGE